MDLPTRSIKVRRFQKVQNERVVGILRLFQELQEIDKCLGRFGLLYEHVSL